MKTFSIQKILFMTYSLAKPPVSFSNNFIELISPLSYLIIKFWLLFLFCLVSTYSVDIFPTYCTEENAKREFSLSFQDALSRSSAAGERSLFLRPSEEYYCANNSATSVKIKILKWYKNEWQMNDNFLILLRNNIIYLLNFQICVSMNIKSRRPRSK